MDNATIAAALNAEAHELAIAKSLNVTIHVLRRTLSLLLLVTQPQLYRDLLQVPADKTVSKKGK